MRPHNVRSQVFCGGRFRVAPEAARCSTATARMALHRHDCQTVAVHTAGLVVGFQQALFDALPSLVAPGAEFRLLLLGLFDDPPSSTFLASNSFCLASNRDSALRCRLFCLPARLWPRAPAFQKVGCRVFCPVRFLSAKPRIRGCSSPLRVASGLLDVGIGFFGPSLHLADVLLALFEVGFGLNARVQPGKFVDKIETSIGSSPLSIWIWIV